MAPPLAFPPVPSPPVDGLGTWLPVNVLWTHDGGAVIVDRASFGAWASALG